MVIRCRFLHRVTTPQILRQMNIVKICTERICYISLRHRNMLPTCSTSAAWYRAVHFTTCDYDADICGIHFRFVLHTKSPESCPAYEYTADLRDFCAMVVRSRFLRHRKIMQVCTACEHATYVCGIGIRRAYIRHRNMLPTCAASAVW